MANDALVVTAGNIELVSSYDIKDLIELRIEKKLNDHVRLYFLAVIPEEKKDSYIEKVASKDIIEVNQIDDNSATTNLFKGLIVNMEIMCVRGIYYMKTEGVSVTYDLDVKLIKRSFQDKNMAYTALIKEVLKDYSGADFIDTVAKSAKTEKFIIEYNETDWQFLIRLASHFNTGIVADCTSEKPKFWFGVPEGGSKGNIEEFNYSVNKRISEFREASENGVDEIAVEDFTYYEIETDMLLNIGDKVQFNSINFIVSECVYSTKNAILSHTYKVSPEKGFSKELILNDNVFRASVEGKVIDVKEDNVRVHLEIDKQQKKDEAFWFPYTTFYTTEGSTGYYCMPELEDSVKLYFPTQKEEEAVVMSSIRRRTKGGDKIDKPDIKYFRTKYKKEMSFSEKDLIISAKDDKVLIKLNEDNGIEVLSDGDIFMKADGDMGINAEEIEMQAGTEVIMKCNTSSVKMDGKVDIVGSLIKVR